VLPRAVAPKAIHSFACFLRHLSICFSLYSPETTLTALVRDTFTSHDFSFVVQTPCYGCKWLMTSWIAWVGPNHGRRAVVGLVPAEQGAMVEVRPVTIPWLKYNRL